MSFECGSDNMPFYRNAPRNVMVILLQNNESLVRKRQESYWTVKLLSRELLEYVEHYRMSPCSSLIFSFFWFVLCA